MQSFCCWKSFKFYRNFYVARNDIAREQKKYMYRWEKYKTQILTPRKHTYNNAITVSCAIYSYYRNNDSKKKKKPFDLTLDLMQLQIVENFQSKDLVRLPFQIFLVNTSQRERKRCNAPGVTLKMCYTNGAWEKIK